MAKNEIELEWTMKEWKKIANKAFLPLIENEDRFIICYGGRGSSKSFFAATKIIYRMLSEEYFKCILVRNIQSTIKDSSFQMLLDIINALQLNDFFKITHNTMTITCVNGNKILSRGMDNPNGIKSISDISCVWYEEDIIDEDAWQTVSTSVRTKKSRYVQEIFTINPTVEDGHYSDNWFYKRFFLNNQGEKSFRNVTEIKLNDKLIPLAYTVHHSTYKDNRFISDEYVASLLNNTKNDPYLYSAWILGEWGAKENNQAFYKQFSRLKHVGYEASYDENLPLHISFDFNVVPHCSAVVCQIEGNTLKIIDEVITKTPNNNTRGICNLILSRYGEHTAGLFIYGDASNQKNDTRGENGVNDYTLLLGYLKEMGPQLRIPSKNPSVIARGRFINDIFAGEKKYNILINENCINLLNDFQFGREAEDGTKLKEKTKKDGITFEKYFHLADAFDYVVCELFKKEFTIHNNGGKTFTYTLGRKTFNEKHSY